MKQEDYDNHNIEEFSEAYGDILWQLSLILTNDLDGKRLYEVIGGINESLSKMVSRFEQQSTRLENLKKIDKKDAVD